MACLGDGYSYAELKTFADDVRQQLLRVKDVAKVELFGVQSERIFVELSQNVWQPTGLDINQVVNQLNQQNAVEGSGVIQTPQEQVQVRIAGQFDAVEQVRAMPVMAPSGVQLRLGDIAEVTRGYEDPPSVKVRHNGREVIALGISMSKGATSLVWVRLCMRLWRRSPRSFLVGMELVNIQDQPKAVTESGQ